MSPPTSYHDEVDRRIPLTRSHHGPQPCLPIGSACVSGVVYTDPEPDAGYKKIESNAFCGKTDRIVPEFIHQANRDQERQFNRQQGRRGKGVVIAVTGHTFGNEKKLMLRIIRIVVNRER